MGLDLVELAMEVENTFSISIRDEDAVTLETPGKLYDYILASRFEGRDQGCLANVTFYKLRRALISVLQIARSEVRLSSDLHVLIPNRRRETWAGLRESMGLRLPELIRPVWVKVLITALGGASTIAAFMLIVDKIGFQTAIFPIILVVAVVSIVLYLATIPLEVEFGPDFATVGGLTKAILRRNYGAISDECQRANAEEVWNTLRSLIAEQLGVSLEDVTKDVSFVKDLRAG